MAEQSPIERAARALLRSQDGLPAHKPEGWSDEIWEEEQRLQNEIEDSDWPKFVADVRAVLQVIRESEDLAALVAGKQALYSCSEDPELADARGCFQAMIDALLNEA